MTDRNNAGCDEDSGCQASLSLKERFELEIEGMETH